MKSRHLRLLVVEDNPLDVVIVQDALAGAGSARFLISRAETLQQAVDMVCPGTFDAVLLDFASDCSTMLTQIADSIEVQDQQQLRTLGHKLNGLFGQFGCSRASELASQMETCQGLDDMLSIGHQVIAVGHQMLQLISRSANGEAPEHSAIQPNAVGVDPSR